MGLTCGEKTSLVPYLFVVVCCANATLSFGGPDIRRLRTHFWACINICTRNRHIWNRY